MKKFLGKLVLASMVLSMAAVAANAAEPTILIDFKKDTAPALGGKTAATRVDIYEEADHYEFVATSYDPFVSMDDASADNVEDCYWVKIRVWNKSDATAVEFFASVNGGVSGDACTHVNIEPNTDGWRTYIAYVPDANVQTVNAYKEESITECYWTGPIDFIRLDPMWLAGEGGTNSGGATKSGDEIWFDYVAFFKTEEDAIAFRDEDCTIQKGADFATVAHKAGSTTPAATEDKPADTTPADTTPADTTPADETPAAQTADVAAIAVLASVLALGTAVVVFKKR